jgi:hypothetical protein
LVLTTNETALPDIVSDHGSSLLWTFEHGVATDSAPSAAQVIVDRDEFERGATVRAGE